VNACSWGSAHREEYGYFLIINGLEARGRERDPSRDPPEHGHGPGHAPETIGERVTFKEFCEASWEILSQEEEFNGAKTGLTQRLIQGRLLPVSLGGPKAKAPPERGKRKWRRRDSNPRHAD
jgi:hypothetical protein